METIINQPRSKILVAAVAGLTAITCILTMLAQAAAPPVLKIAPLGSNQFSIVVTNGVSTTNYTLFWRYQLENPVYP